MFILTFDCVHNVLIGPATDLRADDLDFDLSSSVWYFEAVVFVVEVSILHVKNCL